jgi:PAS domain S-box-containing protein
MAQISIVLGGNIYGLDQLPDLDDVDVYENVRINDAVLLAMRLEAAGVQAIISTGGTASEIERHVQTRVVRANPTYFDLLETLRRLEDKGKITGEKVALMLHSSRVIHLDRLQPFLKNEVVLYQYKDEGDLQKVVHRIYEDNLRVVVGGPSTLFFAERLGIYGHPLYLGRETLQTALEKTRFILESTKKEREESQRLHTVFDLFSDGILATDETGVVTICNPKVLAILGLQKQEVIGKKVYQVTQDPSWSDVYGKGLSQVDRIMEYKKTKIFTSRLPIIVNNRIIGAVGTFQEVEKIQQLEREYRKIQTMGLVAKFTFGDIVGESGALKRTVEQAKAFSKVDSTILISGETGTGKEVFAQSIHNLSCRKYGPFVAVNCAALPENLLESELLGYEEGAFTGAKRGGKPGLFELAHKGTIFLDEINQIPVALQVRILRVIQERQVLRLGGEKVIPVNVRIIAATNEDIEKKVTAGGFRDDLYYRLNVLTLDLPPLRERLEDIPLLANSFQEKFSRTYGPVASFSARATSLMAGYQWPGNIRELVNFVEKYVILNKQQAIKDVDFVQEYIAKKRVREERRAEAGGVDSVNVTIDTLENMENQIVKHVLEKMAGNRAQAALILGVSRTTLWKKFGRKYRAAE